VKYKILVCGAGSIGERHIRNLLKIGYKDIILFRREKKNLRTIKKKIKQFTSLEKALSQKPDIAIITNPTNQHIDTAIKCARSNCHLFIEKPLSNNLKKVNLLSKICVKKKLICSTGFMMRYHPLIKKIKKIIDSKKIGKIIHYTSQWGEDLRLWHPWEDYKISYAANDKMGGGPTLTLSHDIDLAIWFCNQEIKKKYINLNYGSALDIKTHHSSDIILKFKNNTTANIHLDFYQNPPKRIIEIVGTKGRLEFNYFSSVLKHFLSNSAKVKTYKLIKFNRNDMFLDEIKHFLLCVKKNLGAPIPINESIKSLKLGILK
jgi:predicted dehydrogenase